MPFGRILVVCLSLGAASCAELKQGQEPPEGIQCQAHIVAGKDGASLKKALESAKPGDCIIVEGKTYKGSFEVPRGVTVTSAKGTRGTFQGIDASKAAIAIEGGAGSGLCNLAVRDSVGFGISVKGGPVLIKDVVVEKSMQAGLATTCEGCDEGKTIELRDVRLADNKLGGWFRGGVVKWTGGQSSRSKSTSLTGGAGIIGHAGVRLSLSHVSVEDNEAVGVLVDGAGGGSASLESVRVTGNGERGLWAQGMKPRGAGEVAMRISGRSVFENNALVGAGFFESTGIEIRDVDVRTTRKGTVVLDTLLKAEVGDGLLFSSASGTVSNVTLEGNPRVAALIDAPVGELKVDALRVTAPADALKIVVQNDAAKRASVPPGEITPSPTELALPRAMSTLKYTD